MCIWQVCTKLPYVCTYFTYAARRYILHTNEQTEKQAQTLAHIYNLRPEDVTDRKSSLIQRIVRKTDFTQIEASYKMQWLLNKLMKHNKENVVVYSSWYEMWLIL